MNTRLRYQSTAHDAAPKREQPWDRLLARARASSLDRHLTAGRPPRSSHPRAIRAREIVSPAARRELAQHRASVLDQAGRRPVPLAPRAPLRCGPVIAGGLPIDARGAAIASWLLRDRTGPLYNHRSPIEPGTIVREATRQMGSLADRPADGADPDNAECNR